MFKKMMSISFLFMIMVFLLASFSSASPLIENGDKPSHGRHILQLEELWRVGGLDDENNLLGLIKNIVADEQGHLYMLDTQLIEVLVFNADGRYLKSLGRKGDGPGELQRPRDVVLLPDGNVGLVQGFPGKIICVDRNGLPTGNLHPGGDPADGGTFALTKVVAAGSHLAMAGAVITRDEEHRMVRNSIASFDSAGTQLVEYYSQTNSRNTRSNHRDEAGRYFTDSWALGRDGRVWIAPQRNGYRIDVYLANGSLERTITRQYEPYQRSDIEIEQVRSRMTPWGGSRNRSVTVTVEPTMQDIMQMHVDDEGRLWVLNSRGAHPEEPGIHSVWDVFDAEGRFDREVAIACEGRAIEDAIVFPGQGLVVVIKEFADAALAFSGRAEKAEGEAKPLEVICYRMEEW